MDHHSFLGRYVESEFFTGYLKPGEAIPHHPPEFPEGSLVRSKPSFGSERPTIYRVTSVCPSSELHPGDWTIMCRGVETMEFTCGWEGYFEDAGELLKRIEKPRAPKTKAPSPVDRLVRFFMTLIFG